MDNFEYHSPTKVIFGKETEQKVGQEIKAWGGSRVLLHTGGGSVEKSGLLNRVRQSLKEAGLFYTELSGVVPNPRLSKVYEGIALCKREGIDFVLAVGGGSVADSAKAIAVGALDEGDVWDFYETIRVPQKGLPVATIITLAASGSETSMSAVITKEDGWLKRGLNSPFYRPLFSILNPELTYSLPPYQTACGIVDIMMHTMDRYFSPTNDVDFIDRISEGLLQSVVRAGARAMKDPYDYAARADLMWAGSISHNGLTGTGRVTDFSPHQIEHELGGKYDVAHGAGLAAVWGHWARFVYQENVMKFAQFAVRVWNCSMDFENPEVTAIAGIEKTEEFFRSIGMPVNLRDLGIQASEEEIHEMAEKCTFFGKRKIGGFKQLGYKEIKAVLTAANA